MIRPIVNNLESRKQGREGSETFTQEMSESHNPHSLNVAKMVQKSWAKGIEMIISRFGIKSNLLTLPISDKHNTTYGRMQNTSKSDDVKLFVENHLKFSSGIDQPNSLFVQLHGTVAKKDIAY